MPGDAPLGFAATAEEIYARLLAALPRPPQAVSAPGAQAKAAQNSHKIHVQPYWELQDNSRNSACSTRTVPYTFEHVTLKILSAAPTLTISHDYANDWLYLEWHGALDDDTVMAGALKLLELFRTEAGVGNGPV